MQPQDYIFGFRSIIEAIEAGREIDKIMLAKEANSDLAHQLIDMTRPLGIYVQRVPIERINRITRKNHQGALAILSAVTYYNLEHLVPELYEQGRLPFVLVLDGITDVRNFGAIARTCECAAVDAIVIPKHGSVSVSADAVKTSAGALNHIPVCRENNITRAVRFLKDAGYQIVAVSEKADCNYTQANYTGPVALVMGAEDTGISQPVMSLCDTRVAIPMFGKIQSLNVSIAAGIVIYEVVNQRLKENLEVI